MAEVYVVSLSYCMGLLTDQNYQGQRVHPHELSVRAPVYYYYSTNEVKPSFLLIPALG